MVNDNYIKNIFIFVICLLLLSACGKGRDDEHDPTASTIEDDTYCPTYYHGSDKDSDGCVPNRNQVSACKLVALVCNYCCYKSDGAYKESKTEVCGVCIGADF